VTTEGITERVSRLRWGTIVMAVSVWLTVIVGTYVVYPWYRATPLESIDTSVQSEELSQYPRYWLLASEETSEYHHFGMEWKEHVAWLSPILATVVFYIVLKYGTQLAEDRQMRNMTMVIYTLAFVSAAIAGLFGALMLGLMTTGAVISEGLQNFLNWWNPAGPLSGKTGMAILAWLISWGILNNLWQDKDSNLAKAFTITMVLIVQHNPG
jgi:hypothetical protein